MDAAGKSQRRASLWKECEAQNGRRGCGMGFSKAGLGFLEDGEDETIRV